MKKNLRIVRIKKEDAKYFSFLDPYEKLRLLSLPVGFAMGVLDDSNNTVEPVGLLVATISEETIYIEWMAVDPSYRWRGIGDEMLYRVFRMASDIRLESIGVVILPEYERERLLRGSKKYFTERLFRQELSIGGDAEVMLGELMDNPQIKRGYAKKPGLHSLSELTGVKRRELLDKLGALDNAEFSFSPKLVASMLDRDVSVFCMLEGQIMGALLVGNLGDTLYPLYHYAKRPGISDAMIAKAVISAEGKYDGSINVSFILRQEESADIAARVLGYTPEASLMVARIKDFKDMERNG